MLLRLYKPYSYIEVMQMQLAVLHNGRVGEAYQATYNSDLMQMHLTVLHNGRVVEAY